MNIFTKTAAVMTGLVLLTASLAGCASKYPAEEIEAVSEQYDYFYKPDLEKHDFNRKATVEGLTFFYESSLGSKADSAIENVVSVNEFCAISQPVYLSDRMVTRAEEAALYVNVKDDAKLIGATYLAFKGGETLPFGCYAGASAHLLGEKATHPDNLDKYPNAKELQYPHFTRDYGKPAERKAAWGLATEVASDFLSTHTLEELLVSKPEDWGEIFTKYGAEIPTEYTFPVGDTPYPVQVNTESFHYHFACDFVDRYFEDFNTDFDVLKEFVLENEALVNEVSSALSLEQFPEPVDVYFLSNIPYGGYYDFNRNAIVCTGVYSFSSGAVDWTMKYAGISGQALDYALSQYFPFASENASWYKRVAYTSLYQGKQIKDRITGENSFSDLQLGAYRIMRKLYDYNFGEATEESFDALKMAAVVAALEQNNRRTAFENTYSWTRFAFVDFICETYGMDAVLEVNKRWIYAEIDGKNFEEIYEEFEAYLDSLLEESIVNEYNAFLEKNA